MHATPIGTCHNINNALAYIRFPHHVTNKAVRLHQTAVGETGICISSEARPHQRRRKGYLDRLKGGIGNATSPHGTAEVLLISWRLLVKILSLAIEVFWWRSKGS